MNGKRGGENLIPTLIVMIVIGVLVAFAILYALGGTPRYLDDILPTFSLGTSNLSQVHILGYHLEEDSVHYYDGKDWIRFSDEVVALGRFGKVNRTEARNAFILHYMGRETLEGDFLFGRVGPDVFFSDDFVAWRAEMDFEGARAGVRLYQIENPPYVGPPTGNRYPLFITYNDQALYWREKTFFRSSGYVEIPSDSVYATATYRSVLENARAWRDQVLVGRPYEKYLELDGKYYTVRREGRFLVVELDSPVNPAERPEKFSTAAPPARDNRGDWVNPVQRIDVLFDPEYDADAFFNNWRYSGLAWTSEEYIEHNPSAFISGVSLREGWHFIEQGRLVPLAHLNNSRAQRAFSTFDALMQQDGNLRQGPALIADAIEDDYVNVRVVFRTLEGEPFGEEFAYGGTNRVLNNDEEKDEFVEDVVWQYNFLFEPPGFSYSVEIVPAEFSSTGKSVLRVYHEGAALPIEFARSSTNPDEDIVYWGQLLAQEAGAEHQFMLAQGTVGKVTADGTVVLTYSADEVNPLIRNLFDDLVPHFEAMNGRNLNAFE